MSENIKAEHFTKITAGTKVYADIESEQVISISGLVEGDIDSTLRIIIENTGVTKGLLQAPFIEISGKVDGEIRAKNKLVVHSSASVDGQIFTKRFILEEGASINGDIISGVDIENNKGKAKSRLASSANKPQKSKEQENQWEDAQENKNGDYNNGEKKKDGKKDEITASPKNDKYTPPPVPHFVGTVLIGIPASEVDNKLTEDIKEASDKFMEALGFKLEIFDEPVFGSFYQNLTYIKKGQSKDEDVYKLYESGKSAIENALVKKTDSKTDYKLAKAANSLIEAVNKIDEITIKLGNIAIVQIMEDNIQSIATEILPLKVAKLLKENPKLVTNPNKIYTLITS